MHRFRLSGFVILVILLLAGWYAASADAHSAEAQTTQPGGPTLKTRSMPVLGMPYINEISPAIGEGAPAWVELAIKNSLPHHIYLPLIMGGTGSSASSGGITGVDISGYVVSDMDGNSYTIPDELPPVPLDAFVVVIFGPGTDDVDFSDGVATLYAGGVPADLFNPEGDQVALFAPGGADRNGEIVDFFAWGDAPGANADEAIAAELWEAGRYHTYGHSFGAGGIPAPTTPGESMGRWENGWHSYGAASSTPGAANGVPSLMISTVPNNATLASDTFSFAWGGIVAPEGEIVYEFELDDDADFSSPLVQITTSHPGWASDAPMAEGTYHWRARARLHNGETSAWFGPFIIHSMDTQEESRAAVVVKLLSPSDYRIQRKDTTMLDIGGGPNNTGTNPGTIRTGARDRWDGPHEFPGGGQSFRFNGIDNIYCVRASTAMLNSYYGGSISMDEISWYIFEVMGGGNGNIPSTQGIPENDLGFGSGIGNWGDQQDALEWALGSEIMALTFCPNPGIPGYTCPPNPDINGPMGFAMVKLLITLNRPFMSINLNNAHARVVDGYMEIDGEQFVHLVDPVPATCTAGSCPTNASWVDYATFANNQERIYYISISLLNPEIDAASVPAIKAHPFRVTDFDQDGVNGFDEVFRFFTNPWIKDTDKDLVNDKEDIAAYVFDTAGNYSKQLADLIFLEPDTLRKELDWDNDDDGYADGCEDANRNGIELEPGETGNFNRFAFQSCDFNLKEITQPTTGQPVFVGPANQPQNFWTIVKIDAPIFQGGKPYIIDLDDYYGYINAPSQFDILGFAQQGNLFAFKIKPPQVTSPGKYDFMLVKNSISLKQNEAVIYGPKSYAKVGLGLNLPDTPPKPGQIVAIKAAGQAFFSQFTPGDTISLLATVGGSNIVFTPTAVTTNTRDLLALRSFVDGLGAAGGPTGGRTAGPGSSLGALQLLQASLEPSPQTREHILLTFNEPVDVDDDLLGVFGDLNFDGTVDYSDFAESGYASTGVGFITSVQYPYRLFNELPNAPQVIEHFFGGPEALVNQYVDSYLKSADDLLNRQRIFFTVGTLSPSDTITHTIEVYGASELIITVNFTETEWHIVQVYDPNMNLVTASPPDVIIHTYSTHYTYQILNPMNGTWMIHMEHDSARDTGAGGAMEYIATASIVSTVRVEWVPGFSLGERIGKSPAQSLSLQTGIPEPVGLLLPAVQKFSLEGTGLNPTIHVEVFQPGGRSEVLMAFDDGTNGDEFAGDKLYTTEPFTPTRGGAHLVRITVSGIDAAGDPFHRIMEQNFIAQGAIAYLVTDDDPLVNYAGYQELVNHLGIPLVALRYADALHMTAQDFEAQYQAVIVDPAFSEPLRNGRTVLTQVLAESQVPVLGLGTGGLYLFASMGVDLGQSDTQTGTFTSTLPTDPGMVIWNLPYALEGDTPYQVYSSSFALVLTPAAGLEIDILATDPVNGYAVLAREMNLGPAGQELVYWAFEASPADMTTNGERLFINLLTAMLGY